MEDLDGDGARGVGDGDLVEGDVPDFWVRPRNDWEGVLGAVGVVFGVGDLVGAEVWSCLSLQMDIWQRGLGTLVLGIYFSELWIHSVYD